jgi:hypothetical protein
MRAAEGALRWRRLGGLVLLGLALLGDHAWATAAIEDVQPTATEATMPMALGPAMPGALDCVPCAACYLAPAPSLQGFSGACRPPDEPSWQAHRPEVPAAGAIAAARPRAARRDNALRHRLQQERYEAQMKACRDAGK